MRRAVRDDALSEYGTGMAASARRRADPELEVSYSTQTII